MSYLYINLIEIVYKIIVYKNFYFNISLVLFVD